jgi:hypothetical protein
MIRQRSRMFLVVLALALGFNASISYAQQVFGSVFGTVTDPGGAVVAGAKVTITDLNKGTKSEVVTDSAGN